MDTKHKTKQGRQKFILIIILNGILVLLGIAWFIMFFQIVFKESSHQESLSLTGAGLLILSVGFWRFLAHKNYIRTASWFLILSLIIFASYMGWRWGVDLPASLLFFALVLVMSAILLGKRASAGVTGVIIITISITAWLHLAGLKELDHSWSHEIWQAGEVIVTSLIFIIIFLITWLFNRELDRSEEALQAERDDLEFQVAEQTAALKDAKAREMEHIYSLAELGRLSGGIFHDLANPLTALTLNIDQIYRHNGNKIDWEATKKEIAEAQLFCQRMRCLLEGARKQISNNPQQKYFSLNKEINDVLNILNYSARHNKVALYFEESPEIFLNNDAVKFNRIISNIVTNAIESADKFKKGSWVKIKIKEVNRRALITITDNGRGFDNNLKERIMEPFFSTKTEGTGLGLGLAIVQHLVKDDFHGQIRALSQPGKYTVFTIDLPLN